MIVNPITDRTTLIDLREAYLEIPRQTAITRDNAPISIDFIIFYKVADPATTVLTVQNFPWRGGERCGHDASRRRWRHDPRRHLVKARRHERFASHSSRRDH